MRLVLGLLHSLGQGPYPVELQPGDGAGEGMEPEGTAGAFHSHKKQAEFTDQNRSNGSYSYFDVTYSGTVGGGINIWVGVWAAKKASEKEAEEETTHLAHARFTNRTE